MPSIPFTFFCLIGLFVLSCSSYAEEHHDHDKHAESTRAIHQQRFSHSPLRFKTLGPHTIIQSETVMGKIVLHADKSRLVYPRFTGLVSMMGPSLGDRVQKNQVIACVESDNNLKNYAIHAPISGFIVEKKAHLGEHVRPDSPLYQIADLSSVWVDLSIPRSKVALVHKGQALEVFLDGDQTQQQNSRIHYISPIGIEHTQSMLARAELRNPDSDIVWLPGLYVRAKIITKERQVPLAVDNRALQRIDGQTVVFVRDKEQIRPEAIQLGLRGSHYSEVTKGLHSGEEYVVDNSFLVKAELEKSRAEHQH